LLQFSDVIHQKLNDILQPSDALTGLQINQNSFLAGDLPRIPPRGANLALPRTSSNTSHFMYQM